MRHSFSLSLNSANEIPLDFNSQAGIVYFIITAQSVPINFNASTLIALSTFQTINFSQQKASKNVYERKGKIKRIHIHVAKLLNKLFSVLAEFLNLS